ncbi:fasciclin domain-containing protein [Ruegeria marina]|uniref:Uncaracterized surface protein containing fasciclin (FAS1) repeats n=1 Tax=Ruegeria marina TaxID=639004 RepID=A0A1G7CK62_9RHOB|nr:fasciclin domain-containing protein [Ruegeria marina]SDE39066.1 Uncaracterized surface protein containing fasciclin (FAS1) repeats [Ruegeria marina]
MFRRMFLSAVGGMMLAGSAFTPAFAGGKDIVDTAVGAGSFNTLIAAAQAAGLVGALKGDGPFTVFAPTDEAFAALPEGTVESLLKPENKDQLAAVLKYHVVPAKVMSADIAGKKARVLTLQGDRLQVNARNGVRVNDAMVVSADVEASNGVIHVIDKVLLPQG